MPASSPRAEWVVWLRSYLAMTGARRSSSAGCRALADTARRTPTPTHAPGWNQRTRQVRDSPSAERAHGHRKES